jgi:hypothetical protein
MRDELEWVPVEVIWDERAPGEQEFAWNRPALQPALQVRTEERHHRAGSFQDDAREPIEKFGPRRKKDAPKRRKNKLRIEDFDDEDL